MSNVPDAARVFSDFVHTVNENKQSNCDSSASVFAEDLELATEFATVRGYSVPHSPSVIAPTPTPTGKDEDDDD